MRTKCEVAYSKLHANDRLVIASEKPSRRKVGMRAGSQEIGRIWTGREGLEGFPGILGRGSKRLDPGRRQNILSWKSSVSWFGWNGGYMTECIEV